MTTITKSLDVTPLFPLDLLKRPIRERVEFFRERSLGIHTLKKFAIRSSGQ